MEQLGEDNWFADADLGYMGGPEEETPEGLGVYLLTHEIGHVNDNRRGDVTGQMSVDSFGISSSASMGLWERAGKRLSGYAKTAPWEAYAEAFAAFLKGSRGRAVLAYAREYGWGDYAK